MHHHALAPTMCHPHAAQILQCLRQRAQQQQQQLDACTSTAACSQLLQYHYNLGAAAGPPWVSEQPCMGHMAGPQDLCHQPPPYYGGPGGLCDPQMDAKLNRLTDSQPPMNRILAKSLAVLQAVYAVPDRPGSLAVAAAAAHAARLAALQVGSIQQGGLVAAAAAAAAPLTPFHTLPVVGWL
mmetsp:Transcript_29336/g.64941  ORF Transcript_29336/g.64941 Transcript_29336/m.64941 type:complete len:182 (+) Transcript_29336:111-656(+)